MNTNFARNILFLASSLLLTIGSVVAQDETVQRIDYSKAPRYYIIGNVESNNLEFIHKDYLINSLTLVKGDSILIPGDRIKDTYRRLWDQRHFSDVKIETAFRGDTVDINLLLTERRRVASWKFEGIKTNEEKDLKEKLKLRRMSEYSDYLMNTSLKLIRDYYNEKAYRNAKIEHTIEKDTSKFGNFNVTFKIDKGDRVRIKQIKFEGNEALASKALVKSLKKTKKKSINFFANTKFKEKDFAEDRDNITNYMHSKGYRDGTIIEDSLYMIDNKNMGIWIKVEEGKKHYFRDITWVGNSVHSTDELRMMLQLKKGDVYDSEALGSRLGTPDKTNAMEQSIASLYKDKGYLAFIVEPVETVVGDSVDVQVRIIEGKQFRISDVSFMGNTRTNDHVIRRELFTEPGELYSQSLLMRSYQRLASMGQFDAASITPEPVPNLQQETVEIKYSFKEISNDQLELSGGWGGGMFIASVGLNFTNVSIRKFFDKNAWRPYPAGDNQQLSLKLQSNGTYYQAFSVSFTEPWLGGRKPNALSVSFYTQRESNAYMIGARASKFFSTTGGSVSIGKRLSWPDPYFTLSAGISLQSYKMQDWDYFLMKNGRSSTVALNLGIARNSVDDPYQYPSQGSNMSLSLAITPPFSSFDNRDYSDKTMSDQDRYRWVEYHKWKLNAQWFFPLTANNKLVLMARAQYGYLGYFNTNKKSPFEGFTMGGDGLAGYNLYGTETVGLRGYENNSITPYSDYGQYASIYSKYTAEMRYPFVREGSTLVYGVAFMEAGNAYMSLKEFNPFNLKRSAGLGLRIFLPIVGMLGIDWGYGFDKPSSMATKVGGSQFHFSIGAQL